MTLLLLVLACIDPTVATGTGAAGAGSAGAGATGAGAAGSDAAAPPPAGSTAPPGDAAPGTAGTPPVPGAPLPGEPAATARGVATHAIIAEPPSDHNARIPLLGRRPSEAERGEATIWIRGESDGLKSGQVRFHVADGGKLKVIGLGEVVNGRYEAEVPPSSPAPVYVSVVALPDGEAVDIAHAWGALEEPLTLAGKDLVANLAVGTSASWTARTEPAIDRIVTVDQVKGGP